MTPTVLLDIERLDQLLKPLNESDWTASKNATGNQDALRQIRRRAQKIRLDDETREMTKVRRATLEEFAKYLGCDPEFLTLDQARPRVQPEPKPDQPLAGGPSPQLTADERQLLAAYRSAPAAQRQILAVVTALAVTSA